MRVFQTQAADKRSHNQAGTNSQPQASIFTMRIRIHSGFNTRIWGCIETFRPQHILHLEASLLSENPLFRELRRRWPFTGQTERPGIDSFCIPQDEPTLKKLCCQTSTPTKSCRDIIFFLYHLIDVVLSSASLVHFCQCDTSLHKSGKRTF